MIPIWLISERLGAKNSILYKSFIALFLYMLYFFSDNNWRNYRSQRSNRRWCPCQLNLHFLLYFRLFHLLHDWLLFWRRFNFRLQFQRLSPKSKPWLNPNFLNCNKFNPFFLRWVKLPKFWNFLFLLPSFQTRFILKGLNFPKVSSQFRLML